MTMKIVERGREENRNGYCSKDFSLHANMLGIATKLTLLCSPSSRPSKCVKVHLSGTSIIDVKHWLFSDSMILDTEGTRQLFWFTTAIFDRLIIIDYTICNQTLSVQPQSNDCQNIQLIRIPLRHMTFSMTVFIVISYIYNVPEGPPLI